MEEAFNVAVEAVRRRAARRMAIIGRRPLFTWSFPPRWSVTLFVSNLGLKGI